MTTAGLPRANLSLRAWIALGLLVASVFLNYIDRTNLSVGATDIQRDLGLSNYDLGRLSSAFFWTYALMQLLSAAGWLVDRFNVCWVFATGLLIWTSATALSGMAQTFTVLFALRLLLGIGESVSYPSYSRILANNFPEERRGLANGMIDAGSKAGPALGALVGGLYMQHYGWRPFFFLLGFAGMLWLIPWMIWMPRGKGVAAKQHQGDVPHIWEIIRLRPALFSALGLFCTNYFWYFLITWLPAYMEKERHFPKDRMAVFASMAFLALAVSTLCCGWFSDHWIASGASPTRVRKTFAGVGLSLSSVILLVVVVPDDRSAMAILMFSCLAFGAYSCNIFAITQTLAGPRAAGKWTSFQNGVGNLAGVAAPWLTGFLVQRTGQFYWAFVVSAGIVLAGAACFVFGIQRIQPVQYAAKPVLRFERGT